MIKTKYAYLRPEQQLALELIEKGKQKIKWSSLIFLKVKYDRYRIYKKIL